MADPRRWPCRRNQAFRLAGHGRLAACCLTVVTAMAWLLFPLESEAWKSFVKDYRRWYPQLDQAGYSRPGRLLRILLQTPALLLLQPRSRHPGQMLRKQLRRGRHRLRLLASLPTQWIRRWRRRIAHSQRYHDARGYLTKRYHALPAKIQQRLAWLALAAAAGLAAICISQPLSYPAQAVFTLTLLLTAQVIYRIPGRFAGLLIAVLSIVVSSRYLWWRYTSTLHWNRSLDLMFGIGLLLAETYSFVVLLMGHVQAIWPLQRKPVSLPDSLESWPSVDVLIPTYNEDLDMVRNTIFAAQGIDWPADKLKIWVLDDGDRDTYRDFCAEIGVGYLRRAEHKHAKAGNLNHALTQTDGELLAIFDADHVPCRSFLQMTVGWLLRDPKMALVQTPHHFFSADPFERNLDEFRSSPNEGDLFYGLLQDGNDTWDATFFCGSCAVIRRSAIMSIGGFATETVTEDAHTSLRMHRHGWRSAYLRLPQAAGIATGSLAAHINQRIRWARGMTQIFRLDNPMLGKGLSLFQRLCYLNAMMHFLAGLPRLVFLTAPLAFLIFHIEIIYAPAVAITLFVLPHMAHSAIANARQKSRVRAPFRGEIYETVLSWYTARATTSALINPYRGSFNVTAKNELQQRNWIDWRIAAPYFLLAGLNLCGIGFAVWRIRFGPQNEIHTTWLAAAWTVYNLIVLGASIRVAMEIRQQRQRHRIATNQPAAIQFEDGRIYACELRDYAGGGVGIRLEGMIDAPVGSRVQIILDRAGAPSSFPAMIRRHAGQYLGMEMQLGHAQMVEFIRCTFGRADAWINWHDSRPKRHFIGEVFDFVLMGLGAYPRLLGHLPAPVRRLGRHSVHLVRWLLSFMPRRPLAASPT